MNTIVNGTVNTEVQNVETATQYADTDSVVNNSESVKAEIMNFKLVKTIDKVDKETIVDTLKAIDEKTDKATMFKCLLINTMIKYYGADGKSYIKEQLPNYTNDTINSYSMVAEKFLNYEMPYHIEQSEQADKSELMVMNSDVITAISNLDGKITGLRDNKGYPISFTVMHTIRNIDRPIIDKLISDGIIDRNTTQAKAKEIIKPYGKRSTRTGTGTGTGTGTNNDKPFKLSDVKEDSEKIAFMIKIMNTLSDTIKSNEDVFTPLAKALKRLATDFPVKTQNNAQDGTEDAQDGTEDAQ